MCIGYFSQIGLCFLYHKQLTFKINSSLLIRYDFLKISMFFPCNLIPDDIIMTSERYARVKVNVNVATKFQFNILFSFELSSGEIIAENKKQSKKK